MFKVFFPEKLNELGGSTTRLNIIFHLAALAAFTTFIFSFKQFGPMQNAKLLFILLIVYLSTVSGFLGGLTAAAIGVAYWATHSSALILSPLEIAQFIICSLIIILMVGTLKWRSDKNALERAARLQAEENQKQAAFLAETSAVLDSSLDYNTTLQKVADLAVPFFADWCIVDLLDAEGFLKRVAVSTPDPSLNHLTEKLKQRYNPSLSSNTAMAKVIKTGVSQYGNEGISTLLHSLNSQHEIDAGLSNEMGFKSFITVPMISRGRTLGAISFFISDLNRHYNAQHLPLAQDLARRAAMAVDNADLYRRAKEAVDVRDEFLSIASHELKTPLTSLQLLIQLLRHYVQNGPTVLHLSGPDSVSGMLDKAERQCRRLTKLMNDLLDVTRITTNKFEIHPEPTCLAQISKEISSRFQNDFMLAHCPFKLKADSNIVGFWDVIRMEQILTNLISNAIKYGHGEPIELNVTSYGDDAKITVKDYGIGIAREQQKRIFERFERAASSKNYTGLGLGLYIVNQIVQAHGGSIHVDSTLGHGSTFTVVLPKRMARQEQATA